MSVLGVIPARLASTRLPHKPLQLLAGEPLVVRVARRVAALAVVDELVVATEAPEVAEVVRRAGFRPILTRDTHPTGTDRVAEVTERPEFAGYDIIVNIQGDEPFVPGPAIRGSVERVRRGDDVGTAAAPLDPRDATDPARVKVVLDVFGRALYFSRAPIPFLRDPSDSAAGLYWQHLGVYAYSRAALARWVGFPPSPLELAERLEQLRALQHGLTIGVARLEAPVLPGVDTVDDLRRAEAHWSATQETSR